MGLAQLGDSRGDTTFQAAVLGMSERFSGLPTPQLPTLRDFGSADALWSQRRVSVEMPMLGQLPMTPGGIRLLRRKRVPVAAGFDARRTPRPGAPGGIGAPAAGFAEFAVAPRNGPCQRVLTAVRHGDRQAAGVAICADPSRSAIRAVVPVLFALRRNAR